MTPRFSKRSLGDPDAMKDKGFSAHFVSSEDLDAILNTETMVVYGSKGSGKSALRRALTEIHKDEFCVAGTVDLNEISFSQIYSDLQKINQTTQAEIPLVARAAWRNVLALFVVELVTNSLPENHSLRRRTRQFLAAHRGLPSANSNNRLLEWIERVFKQIETYVVEEELPLAGLTPEQRMGVVAFPGVDGLGELLQAATDHCRSTTKRALVCLDGLDTIVDHTAESRSAIFAGLIDAIDQNRTDAVFEGAVCFKAFLPAELTDDAHLLLWDADKRPTSFTHRLRWSQDEFQKFIAKRLAPYTRTRGTAFRENWEEIFPALLHNKKHDVEEEVFSFVLRHTLHRPRQLLIQLQSILDRWDAHHEAVRIDPSFIAPVVSETSAQLAEWTVDQLSRRYSNVYAFFGGLRGSPSVMTQLEFMQRIRKQLFPEVKPGEIDVLVKELYDLGLFGLPPMADGRPVTEKKMLRCHFGSIGPRVRGRVMHWEPADLVAISPMFDEYCALRESAYGPITPFVS